MPRATGKRSRQDSEDGDAPEAVDPLQGDEDEEVLSDEEEDEAEGENDDGEGESEEVGAKASAPAADPVESVSEPSTEPASKKRRTAAPTADDDDN